MRLKTVLLAICLSVLVASGARAQGRPNFSGTWKMNLEKSKLSDGTPIPYYTEFVHEIDHKEPQFQLTEKIKAGENGGGDRTVRWNATTDGKEYDTKVGNSSAKVSVAWNDSALLQKIAAEDWAVVRTSRMSEDGKTITAEWVITQAGGTQKATEVWE